MKRRETKQKLKNNTRIIYDPEISYTLIEEGLLDLLIVGDGLQAILGGRGNKKMVENISALIQAHPEKIYISRNSTVLIKAIQELGKTVEGKEALKKLRFLFINSFLFHSNMASVMLVHR